MFAFPCAVCIGISDPLIGIPSGSPREMRYFLGEGTGNVRWST